MVKGHLQPAQFSFFDYRGSAFHQNRGWRVDHVLATPSVADEVADAWIDRDWREQRGDIKPSDHCPVGIELA